MTQALVVVLQLKSSLIFRKVKLQAVVIWDSQAISLCLESQLL